MQGDAESSGQFDLQFVTASVTSLQRLANAVRESALASEAVERAVDTSLSTMFRSDGEQARVENEEQRAREALLAANEEYREAGRDVGRVTLLRWDEKLRADIRETARLTSFDPGQYSVVLRRFDPFPDSSSWSAEEFVGMYLEVRLGFEDGDEIASHVSHVGPQEVVGDISLRDAVDVKEELRELGGIAEVKDIPRRESSGRQPIPERVRNEVWRRDGGACVDCGSRERLEFDHIIPVIRGGSNTARNIELRCEACNRSKSARIG